MILWIRSLPMNEPARPATPTQYYPYIDGLRALAVLSVLVYHLHGSWLPGGFVGVDVFFVISGFVVSASVANFQGVGLRRFLEHFYARRITRIFPALIVCLLVTALATALLVPASWLSSVNQKTGLYAFFGLSNFVLAQDGRDYFAPTAEFNPFTHTWSLAVEEQFYLLFPLLFVAWLSGRRGRGLSISLFAIAVASSLGWAAWQSQANPTHAYYLTPSRFWELGAGVLLYQMIGSSREAAPVSRQAAFLRSLLGAAALVTILLAFAISLPDRFPVPGALPAVVGTLGVIASLHRHPELRLLHGLLGCRPMVSIGKVSYSLYLWHWPVFVLFRWTWGLETTPLRILAVALAFLLAVASWRFVETPIRHGWGFHRIPQRAVITGGLVVLAGAWGGAKGMALSQPYISLSAVSRDAHLWYPHGIPEIREWPGCTAEPERHNVEGGRLLVYRPKGCADSRPVSEASIYVIGDSHAMAYEGLFKQYAIRNATPIYVYTNAGCPFVSLQPWRDLDDARCRFHTDAALRDLRTRLKPGDVLFLPSLRLSRFSDQWIYFGEEHAKAEMFGRRAEIGRHRSLAYAVKTLGELAGRGIHVVLEAPKPLFKAPPFRCADWFNRSNPICTPGFSMPRDLLDAYRQPVLKSFAELSRRVPAVSVWDPYSILCSDRECNAWRDGKPLFLDGDHISGYGNSILLPSFTAAMNAKLGH